MVEREKSQEGAGESKAKPKPPTSIELLAKVVEGVSLRQDWLRKSPKATDLSKVIPKRSQPQGQ